GLLQQGRVLYVCTNGVFMRKKMKEYLAAIYSPEIEPQVQTLIGKKLISEKDAETIRKSDDAARKKTVIRPTQWMYWNVHLDGLEFTHDLIVEREGVFKECIEAIKMAKILGYQVATNTTVYKEADMSEIEDMFKYLSSLGVDGHTISPGYDYDAAKKDMVKRLGKDPKDFFLTRDMTRQKFAKILDWGRAFTIFGTPIYQEFLAGKREMTCTAWAIPTYNIKGWKGPCYLMTDGHYSSYQELLEKVEWEKYGVVNGKARDSRCEHCMVHCGYDPSAALGTNYETQWGDNWKNFKYNFGARPAAFPFSSELERRVYNGVSIGKGHLAEAKAAINPAAGAKGAFSRNGDDHEPHVGTHCGTNDTSERDELQSKTAADKPVE
ncbi:MAG TPA: adenosyl-hopene transferase HpnH, partial [Candidatus Saccharimonadales bacterium]|nr:adenosyl-hopene transferase HpnH [Candidatus Saccharimonadales bacterium]